MPRANRLCSWPSGCLSKVVRNGRCEDHSFERFADPWYRKGSVYDDSLSDSVKRIVRERDQFTCRMCGAWPSHEVDHKIPKFLGGHDNLDNLQTLCYSCHNRKSSSEGHTANRMKREGRL